PKTGSQSCLAGLPTRASAALQNDAAQIACDPISAFGQQVGQPRCSTCPPHSQPDYPIRPAQAAETVQQPQQLGGRQVAGYDQRQRRASSTPPDSTQWWTSRRWSSHQQSDGQETTSKQCVELQVSGQCQGKPHCAVAT